MKNLILLFFYLYHQPGKDRLGNDRAVWDHRNFLHGFLGTLIWAIVFLATAHLLNYKGWVLLGWLLGTLVAFSVALIWELIQKQDPNKRFSWRDVWASNWWFLPLYFVVFASIFVAKKAYLRAEKEFLGV